MNDFSTPNTIPPLSTDDELKKLDMPCLVIAADKDISFPGVPLIERVKLHLNDLETELLKNTRHSPPTTDEFRAWLERRLNKFYGKK